MRPDLARVGIEGRYLVVRIPWPIALAAFRRKLQFDRDAITRVAAIDPDSLAAELLTASQS
jgi:hypothetical protein